MRTISCCIGVGLIALVSGCASRPPAASEAAAEPGMLLVRDGRFTMGRDEGDVNERPAHKVTLSSYAIDRTEVSASDFSEFLNAAGNDGESYFTPDDYATVVIHQTDDGGRNLRFKARPGFELYPANNVSWRGAEAYCRWRGKRLPTEAEWEKAARGPDKRLFPWGKRPPGEGLARFDQFWEEKTFDVLVPVDALAEGASPYGLLNMAGNVLEWVSDWYRQNLCEFCNPDSENNLWLVEQLTSDYTAVGDGSVPLQPLPPRDTTREGPAPKRQAPPRDNPTGPSAGSFKVLRGGSWQDSQDVELTTTRRFRLDPTQRLPITGFRCSKDETPEQPPPPASREP